MVDGADSHDNIGLVPAGQSVGVVVPQGIEARADLTNSTVASWAGRIGSLQVDTIVPEGACVVNAVNVGAIVPQKWVGSV